MKNKLRMEYLIKKEIKDLGYSVENGNKYIDDLIENAIEFSEIASKKELKEYIENSLELIPSSALQGDSF